LPGIRRYVQNTPLPGPAGSPPYDGVDEIWVDNETSAAAYLEALCDGAWPDVIDMDETVMLLTVDHVVRTGAPIGQHEILPKRMTFFRRKPGMTRDEMLRYWRGVHGPLAASVPHLRRYVQSAALPTSGKEGEPRFDGVAQIWFDDDAGLQAVVRSALFRESVKPDELNFIASDAFTLSVQERRVVEKPLC
jgi:uncharacterized protein (TIGR02118 family)